MGSVIATWRARLTEPEDQARLTGYVERLGRFVEDLRERHGGGAVPEMTRLISARRSEGLPATPARRTFDGEIGGTLVIDFDLFPGAAVEPSPLQLVDRASALADARSRGLRLVEEERGRHFAVIERAVLRGADFRIFDPRDLYPGSDRMSFVFVEGTGWPLLDGLMVDVAGASGCAESRSGVIRSADFHLSLPYLHLRYLLEDWCACFFGWVRHFHVPGLEYTAYETNPGFGDLGAAFRDLERAVGRNEAEEMLFAKLLSDHEAEVRKWVDQLAGWADPER